MYEFFVLGQIPGTGLIISFWMWAEMASLLVMLLAWAAYRRRRQFMEYNVPTISTDTGTLQTATAQ